MIGEAIYYLLKSNPVLSGIGIFPLRASQTVTMPFIVYYISAITPTPVKINTSPLDEIEFTVEVHSREYADVIKYAAEIRKTLDGFCGTVNNMYLQKIFFQGQADIFDEGSEANGQTIDFLARLSLVILLDDYYSLDYSLLDYNVN